MALCFPGKSFGDVILVEEVPTAQSGISQLAEFFGDPLHTLRNRETYMRPRRVMLGTIWITVLSMVGGDDR